MLFRTKELSYAFTEGLNIHLLYHHNIEHMIIET